MSKSKNLSDAERSELLPWVYFVGAGYFPSVEAFALGMESSECIESVFSEDTLDTEVSRLYQPDSWVLVYFIVTKDPGRMRVTKDDALWFLANQSRY